jgi:hypothetical protein
MEVAQEKAKKTEESPEEEGRRALSSSCYFAIFASIGYVS